MNKHKVVDFGDFDPENVGKGKTMHELIAEHMQEQQKLPDKKEMVDRIVYVARVTEVMQNKKDIGALFEGFFNRYHNEAGVPEGVVYTGVTGILLILQQTCVHLIEGSSKVIKAHLRELNSTPKHKRVIDDVHIIVSTEDIPKRIWPCWVSRVLNVGRSGADTEPEDLEPWISECYQNLLQLGSNLSQLDKSKLEEALDTLRSKYRDLLPANERLLTFIQSELTLDLSEWLEVFDSPIDIVLERGIALLFFLVKRSHLANTIRITIPGKEDVVLFT